MECEGCFDGVSPFQNKFLAWLLPYHRPLGHTAWVSSGPGLLPEGHAPSLSGQQTQPLPGQGLAFAHTPGDFPPQRHSFPH